MPRSAVTRARGLPGRNAEPGRSTLPPLILLLFVLQLLPLISGTDHPMSPARATTPMTWDKYAGNPVFMQGPTGAWDSACVGTKTILIEAGQYTMWYGGSIEAYRVTQIGRAVSTDGFSWTRDSLPVLQPGGAGSWDGRGVANAIVLKEGAVYKMWYVGFDGYNGNYVTNAMVGYATSSDGRLWTKYAGNPVMAGGLLGEWDGLGVIPSTILREDGIYKMWYSGINGTGGLHLQIGHATSADGISWNRHGGNPILKEGLPGSWEPFEVDHFSVVNASGTYHGWYGGDDGANWNIGHATSPDGLNWTKDPDNPVLPYGGNVWESSAVLDPFVIYNGTTFLNWYTSTSSMTDPWTYSFQYAEARRPSPPSANAPADDAWTNLSRPSFSWSFQDLGGNLASLAFQLQVGVDSGFSAVVYDSGRTGSPAFSHSAASAIPDGKYFWRVRAWDRNDVGSGWSAPARLNIDTTPPANPPTLFSTTHSVGRWSGRTAISVQWTVPPGGDTGSGYDGFSIEWDSSPTTVPDGNVDIAGNSTTSPAMPGSDSIWFHLRARDRAGNWNPGAAHLGPFRVDPTPPRNPLELQSPDHSPRDWSNSSIITMSWSGADGNRSGVDGYSVLWDEWPKTVPENIINVPGDITSDTSDPLADGQEWHFHLRTVDAAGNWNDSAIHFGPFWIDATPPSSATGLISSTHTTSTWSNDPLINISWWDAPDALSGPGGYSFSWDNIPGTVPPAQAGLGGGTRSAGSPALSDGAWYFHLRAVDAAGNWEDGAAHSGPYWMDLTPPGNVGALASKSHTVGQPGQADIINVSWSAADGGPSGISAYSWSWDGSPDTLPPEAPTAPGGALSASSPVLADGEWYFHVRARDGAGNWATGAAHLGPFVINTTPAEIPDLPPVIDRLFGPDDTSFLEGVVNFSVLAHDPEGKALSYRWFINRLMWGSGENLSHYFTLGVYEVTVKVSDGRLSVFGTFNFTVLVPPPIPPPIKPIRESGPLDHVPPAAVVGGAVAIWAVAALTVLSGIEIIKYHFILFFLPLFTRLHKEEVLDNELRGMIRGAIGADPGIHYNELVRQINVANGTVAYHLMTLEREGIIKSRRDGVLKRFYPGEMRLLEIPVRLTGLQLLILRTVQRQEGLNQRMMADIVELPYLTVHRQINRMAEMGVLRLDKRGISTRCFVEDRWKGYDTENKSVPLPKPDT